MPYSNRDSKGRFVQGNVISINGWLGLVKHRFNGDFHIAKEYVAQLGRHSYAKMCDSPYSSKNMKNRMNTVFFHPGTPEQFIQHYKQRLEFTLDDVPEQQF